MIPWVYYVDSLIDDNGHFVLLNTSRCDIQIQIIHTDIKKNTSVVEEARELIDLASCGEEQSADSSQRQRNRVT